MDNEALKKAFKNLQPTLTKDVNPDFVIDVLLSKDVISENDFSDLRQAQGSKDRCRDFLSRLYQSTHPETFIQLRQALVEEYPRIVEEIDKQMASLTTQPQKKLQKGPSIDGKFRSQCAA